MIVPNTAGYQSYQRNKYETASPHRLITMLYEGILRFGAQAVKAVEDDRVEDTNKYIQKMQDILYELLTVLNKDQGGEVADNLSQLYLYMIDALMQANIQKTVEPVHEVMSLVQDIKQAWEEIGKGAALHHG